MDGQSREDALLRAIARADAADTGAHRVYADWLADCGREAEARRISRGCDLLEQPDGEDRYDRALAAYRELPALPHLLPEWEPPWEQVRTRVAYDGGLPRLLQLDAAYDAPERFLADLGGLAPVRAVRWWNYPLRDDHVAALAVLPHLERLRFDGALIDDALPALAELPALDQLEIFGPPPGVLSRLAGTPLAARLRALEVDSPLTADEAQALGAFPALRALRLTGLSEPVAELALRCAPHLERLVLPWANEPRALPPLPALRHLSVEVVGDQCGPTLSALLARLPRLESLDLALRRLPDGLLPAIGALPELRRLSLRPHRHARALGLSARLLTELVAAAPDLRELALVGDADLRALDLAPLAALDLDHLEVHVAARPGAPPPPLPPLPRLRRLTLSEATPASLQLGRLPHLRELHLTRLHLGPFESLLDVAPGPVRDLEIDFLFVDVTLGTADDTDETARWADWLARTGLRRLVSTAPDRLREAAPDVIVDDRGRSEAYLRMPLRTLFRTR